MFNSTIAVVIPQSIKSQLILKFVEDFSQMSLEPSFLLWEMFHYFLMSDGFMASENKMRLTTDFQALITLVQQIETVKSCKS